ncbi:uncharacterized protein I206_104234 [Kwoniella pini CBS 10737]|uniref:Uncharacterized protein n=1 Tax=Kwoniella pini CBS 10737 TaxID=1296096 RepID=A0A1B9I285_9TREE|nr:uncharacterized protein I206_04188 [Kwoniella pini CBS 10737]OCF49666.1 hypothetical protein I206_04188 [Kwoniella pini CBS 10737]
MLHSNSQFNTLLHQTLLANLFFSLVNTDQLNGFQFENDSIGIEGFFTKTENLENHLTIIQKTIYDATVSAGLEDYSNGATSLESLQTYRYGIPPKGESEGEGEEKDLSLSKKAICQPCRECLRDLNKHLEKKASRCGQFCSRGANCITPGCTACYYTGGACAWQKSCQWK